MATIASAANGNWSVTGTWTGGVVPGTGDVAKFNHVVTLDVAAQVQGVDPTGTGMLKASGSNRLACGNLQIAYFVSGVQTT